MKSLTLTPDERAAIDWIGRRYSHGYDLFDLLTDCDSYLYSEDEWTSEEDITFEMSDLEVDEARKLIEADNCACFSPELKAKLERL